MIIDVCRQREIPLWEGSGKANLKENPCEKSSQLIS
jgi:hypothetical protein